MAKTSRKTVGRARKAGPRRATKTRRAPATTRAATNDAERHVDGCDIDFAQGELTADAELPEAKGGVEVLRKTRRAATRRRG